MPGIVSYGAYIPIYRLSSEVINQVWRGRGKGEKAVANFDEDSLTLGVEAARDCIKGAEKNSIDALYFASTTLPYKEKQTASIVAAALDLRENIVTADITDSLRSGTIALGMALDAVRAGSAKKVLVIASDSRIPWPDSVNESILGDGAVAVLIGDDETAIEIEGSHYISSEIVDVWRAENDKMTRSWEDRFVREEGYLPHLEKAVRALLTKRNLSSQDITKAAFYAPDDRLHREMVRKLGLDAKTQVQDPLFNKIGNTGTAFALMILVGALEEARPQDRILLANYGDGADAHILHITEAINKIKDKNGIRRNLQSKLILDTYGKYIKFRQLMEFEPSLEFEQRSSPPQIWRDRKWVYRFHGHRCGKCGKVQFPMQRFCMYCQAPAEFLEEIPLADKKGTLFTYSIDERAPVIDPPNVLAAVNFEGGGRFYGSMTDRDTNKLEVGMPMELTFRRILDAAGIRNYFWKCKPLRG
ncbi:hydroxymethylglutaryl-CoA synthase family protein [Chloroflexota bacterium]